MNQRNTVSMIQYTGPVCNTFQSVSEKSFLRYALSALQHKGMIRRIHSKFNQHSPLYQGGHDASCLPGMRPSSVQISRVMSFRVYHALWGTSCPSEYIMPFRVQTVKHIMSFRVYHALQGANCEVYDSLQSISYGKRFSNTLRGWGCGMIYSAFGSISRKHFK